MKRISSLLRLAVLLPLLGCLPLSAQQETSDLGLWNSIDGSTKLTENIGLSLEAEYRLRDYLSATDRTSVGASLAYKNKTLVPWLKADVGYTFIYKNNPAETNIKYEADGITPKHKNVDAAYWGVRHRATVSLSGSWKAGRFKIGVRERYQYTYTATATCERTRWYYNPFYADFHDDVEDIEEWYLNEEAGHPDYSYFTDAKNARSDHKLRSRLDVAYNIKHCKFEPFAEVELYNDLDNRFAIDKLRYTVGTDYKLTKTAKFTAFYRFQDHSDEDEAGGHVLGLGYSFDF